jgi:hypothetical protein
MSTVSRSPFWGTWTRGSSAGRLLVPPSCILCEAPFLVGSGAEESTLAVAPLTGRQATTPSFAAPISA